MLARHETRHIGRRTSPSTSTGTRRRRTDRRGGGVPDRRLRYRIRNVRNRRACSRERTQNVRSGTLMRAAGVGERARAWVTRYIDRAPTHSWLAFSRPRLTRRRRSRSACNQRPSTEVEDERIGTGGHRVSVSVRHERWRVEQVTARVTACRAIVARRWIRQMLPAALPRRRA